MEPVVEVIGAPRAHEGFDVFHPKSSPYKVNRLGDGFGNGL